MTVLSRTTLICLATLLLLALPPAASASYKQVIQDCAEDGTLDRSYSQADLKKAEDRLPSDLDEYSDCREVIAAALGGGKGSGAGGAGGISPQEAAARQQDRAALDALTGGAAKKPRVKIGDKVIEPGGNGLFSRAGGSYGMPLPLLLALIAVGLLAAGGAAYALRRRIPALSSISLPRPSLPRVPLPRLRR